MFFRNLPLAHAFHKSAFLEVIAALYYSNREGPPTRVPVTSSTYISLCFIKVIVLSPTSLCSSTITSYLPYLRVFLCNFVFLITALHAQKSTALRVGVKPLCNKIQDTSRFWTEVYKNIAMWPTPALLFFNRERGASVLYALWEETSSCSCFQIFHNFITTCSSEKRLIKNLWFFPSPGRLTLIHVGWRVKKMRGLGWKAISAKKGWAISSVVVCPPPNWIHGYCVTRRSAPWATAFTATDEKHYFRRLAANCR